MRAIQSRLGAAFANVYDRSAMARFFLLISIASGCVSGRAGTRDPEGGLIDWDSGPRRDAGMRDGGGIDAAGDAGPREESGSMRCETSRRGGNDQGGCVRHE